MLAQPAEFRWLVYLGGYVCRDNSIGGKPARTVEIDFENRFDGLKERRPMHEAPTIHRSFGSLDQTEADVIRFANEWGPLTGSHDRFEEEQLPEISGDIDGEGDDDDACESDDFFSEYEETETWYSEIRRMKALLGLWDVVKSGKEQDLGQHIKFEQDGFDEYCHRVVIRFHLDPKIRWDISFPPRERLSFSAYLSRGGKIALAQRCIFDLINESLWGRSSSGVGPGRDGKGFVLLYYPNNLQAALWLSFVQEIVGEKSVKQCAYCKAYFEVSTEQNKRRQRSDKQFCSPKCRAAAFRERRDRAGLNEIEESKNGGKSQ